MKELISLRDKVLLFVEDDLIIREKTVEILQVLFKEVIVASDGEEGLIQYMEHPVDIIFTDIKMPKMSGIEFIEEIRKTNFDIPVIFFSAHSDQKHLLKAIDLCTIGYVLKPTKIEELLAVFAKCARHMHSDKPHILTLDQNLEYHLNSNELIVNGNPILLTHKEHDFFNLLIQKHPGILTKNEAIEIVWAGDDVSESAIKNIVAKLRTKLGKNLIKSIPGIGWKFDKTQC